jgi:hypothetical protein
MPDGSFKNIKRQKNQVPLIGERVIYKEEGHSPFFSQWITVASVACLLVLAVLTYRLVTLDNLQPAYLVALDINPSIEVYADKNMAVTNVTAMNEDGEKLADMIKYKGKSLLDTINLIIEQSIDNGYLNQNKRGLIKITIIPMQKNSDVNENSIRTSIQELLLKDNIEADLNIGFETEGIIKEAHQSGLSINRYILYKMLKGKGISITVEKSRNMPLESLQNYETLQKNDNTGWITPQSNTNGGGISGKPDIRDKSGYKDGNTHEENQNGEMPDKNSIPETIKESDTPKRITNNDGKSGASDKMSAEKSEISGFSQPAQTNNSAADGSGKTEDSNNSIAAPATKDVQPDGISAQTNNSTADGGGKTEDSNNSIAAPATKDVQPDGISDSKTDQTNQNSSNIESPNKDSSQPSSSGNTAP